MLNRPVPNTVRENPLLDSPYNQQEDLRLGSYPINNDWMLLDTDHFTLLEGSNWAFLGAF